MEMKELTNEEEQWLKAFAKENQFFDSLLEFYERNDYLTDKQYYCLARDINDAEEKGDKILDKEELRFLEENAENNEELTELLETYEDNGFLDDYEYRQLMHLKYEFTKKESGAEDFSFQKSVEPTITKSFDKSDPKKTIIRIPCPHCGSLCPPQVKFCPKCGEPLKNLNNSKF